MTGKLTEDQLRELIRNVSSWAPHADPQTVEDRVNRAWGNMDADPYDISPLAFIGARLHLGLPGDQMEKVLRVTEHLVTSMADFGLETESAPSYEA